MADDKYGALEPVLKRWLGATELLDQTVAIVQEEIHEITLLQSRLSDDIITHVKALGVDGEEGAAHVGAIITATQMEDQTRQRQEHIVMALETIADTLKTLRKESLDIVGNLEADENFRRSWAETLVARQNMDVVRQRFAKALLGEDSAENAPSEDSDIELF